MILIRKYFSKEKKNKKDHGLGKEAALAGGMAGAGVALSVPINVAAIKEVMGGKKSKLLHGTVQEANDFKDRYYKSNMKKDWETINLGGAGPLDCHNIAVKGVQKDPNAKGLKGKLKELYRKASNRADRQILEGTPLSNSNEKRSIANVAEDASPATIAHELGHGKDFLENGHHRQLDARKIATNPKSVKYGAAVGAITGFKAGRKEAKDEDYKEGALSKYSGALTHGALAAPMLREEFAASKNGMKILKNLGYSKSARRKAAKELLACGASYAGVPLMQAGVAQGTHALAKKIGSLTVSNKDKKNKRK